MLDKIALPVAGKFTKTFLFGEDPAWYHKIFGEAHNGIDFAVPVGTPVIACDNGGLYWADEVNDADGLGIILSHSWGYSMYWHNRKNLAKFGTVISKGDVIGESGATGYATGPHVHFGIKLSVPTVPNIRGYVDPEPYFGESVPVVTPPAPVGRYHIVLFGESLWSIAQKYYGDGAQWPKIYNANLDKIKNPRLILTWMVLRIP